MDNREPPLPLLSGPETPGMRRLRDAIASGKEIPSAPPGERSVSYLLEIGDVMYGSRLALVHNRLVLGILTTLCLWLIGITVFATISDIHKHDPGAPLSAHLGLILTSALTAIAAIALIFVALQGFNYLMFKPQLKRIGIVTSSLSPEGIYTKSSVAEGKAYWKAFKQIEKTKTHLVFWQSLFAAVIPLWAFENDEAAEVFYREAQERHRSATRPSAKRKAGANDV